MTPRWAAYTVVIVLLALNAPFIMAALSRFPQELRWTSVAGAYTALVFAGYYVFLLYVLLTLMWVGLGAWPRVFTAASATILTLALCYFVVDGVVYRIAKAHVDAFWIQYLFTTFEGLGIGFGQIAAGVLVLAAILGIELLLLRTARRMKRRGLWCAGLVAVCMVSLVITQAIHAVAYEVSDTRFTSITPELPFYFPVRSTRNAQKYGRQLSLIHASETDASDAGDASFRYPMSDAGCSTRADASRKNVVVLLVESWRADALSAAITPRLSQFEANASTFVDHFSSGNSTPSGVFPLFYGIHSTYWKAVKANNVRIHNPVLIDALQDNGYALGIFAKSDFEAHKIKEAVFRGVPIEESFAGTTAHENDRDMTNRLFDFMSAQQAAKKPFFGFAFYKSTHYNYDYPADSAPFKPARKLNVLRASAGDDPAPMLNDYRNAVHYVDGLIGDLLDRMRASGMLENTIVVITGDHGEEFNDNRDNTWMHGGNFDQYQTKVPLIIYAPGKPSRRITTATSEVDIAPTILQEALHCGWNASGYSNGFNLFGRLPEQRPIIAASYIHHALILGNKVFVVWPMYVQRYDLAAKKPVTGWPDATMMRVAMEELTRFYAPAQPREALPRIHIASVAGAQETDPTNCPRGNLPAYAHNDYENAHPLTDALSLGYKGVEADVFLVNGVLQLGHKRQAAESDGNFEHTYLAPLRALVARCGSLTADGQPFLLNIEIKEASRPTYDSVVAVLKRYQDLLVPKSGRPANSPPPVQAVLVGWYPPGFADSVSIPLWRKSDIERSDKPPADAGDADVGLIGLDYLHTIGKRWELPAQRRRWLSVIRATKAAFPERRIRAYHVPVDERVYRDLLDAGVDLIGSTELAATAKLLGAGPL